MNAPLIPRIPEIALEDFDSDYRHAEIEHRHELEKMVPEIEKAARNAPLTQFDFFDGGQRTALDIGCGIGTLPFLLARRNPNANVIGVDFSEESIAYAKRHYAPQVTNLSFHVGSVDDLSRLFREIDMITCIGALHHFPSLHTAVQQIMETLTDDGAFFLSDLNRANIHAHFSEQELAYLDEVRRLPEQARAEKLRCDGYTEGRKMRRFLTLMSFQAAYTPAEIAAALGSRYAFRGGMAEINYLLVAYKKKERA